MPPREYYDMINWEDVKTIMFAVLAILLDFAFALFIVPLANLVLVCMACMDLMTSFLFDAIMDSPAVLLADQ